VLKIGLTGGIASGKSTVAAMFAERGITIVDTDRIAREVVATGQPALDAIRARFGSKVFHASGELDRTALRRLVFADPAQRQDLESILHPLIRARTQDELARASGPYAIAAVPLLVETSFGEIVDRVLVVDCPQSAQLERLTRRDRIPRPEALAMIAAQADRATRLRAADDVLDNSGTLDSVRAQVAGLHAQYLELASRKTEPI
jgi:dephospho-CoA kinase